MTKQAEPPNQAEIKRKISEFNTLTNRMRRYWKKLTKESITIAKQRGLETYVVEYNDIHLVTDITIKKRGDEIVDDSQLLELAKEKYPSLYHKYKDGMQRHRELRLELELIYDFLPDSN